MPSMRKFTILAGRGQRSPVEASRTCVRSFVLTTRNSRVSLDKKLTPPDGSEP
ncbi:hypothetical protein FIBSPDRAFT_876444 [Athelia psychrophila]|uniref:Uncharacterized protein n=1 Tax=Athelia psychrophila TaxID=1759441 RepID=A0A167WVY6_9AGAM|nr:hypothetical protein FIBSPDRAFT_876444 [Fibularhizoctonia sp. CBS 109695]